MIWEYPKEVKIVRRYQTPDTPTGDEILVTEDGRHWTPSHDNYEATGTEKAKKVGNYLRRL